MMKERGLMAMLNNDENYNLDDIQTISFKGDLPLTTQ